jgi:hypothetical protein
MFGKDVKQLQRDAINFLYFRLLIDNQNEYQRQMGRVMKSMCRQQEDLEGLKQLMEIYPENEPDHED